MDKQIFFNGGFHAETEKLLSVQDRGLCFADGLFEVIRCVDGKFLLFSQHLQRMRESAEFLRMEFPYSTEELLGACRELARRNEAPKRFLEHIMAESEVFAAHLIGGEGI